MSRTSHVALLLSFGALVSCSKDSGGSQADIWGRAKMGMSQEQVQNLYPRARRSYHINPLSDAQELLILDDTMDGRPVKVGFYFSFKELAYVVVKFDEKFVDVNLQKKAIRDFTQKCGAPIQSTNSIDSNTKSFLTASEVYWKCGSQIIALKTIPSLKSNAEKNPKISSGLYINYFPKSDRITSRK